MNPREAVTLREYIEAILREHEKRYDERMGAAKEAVELATTQLEARLDLLNELRSDVLTREEYDGKHQTLLNEIMRNREAFDRMRGEVMTRAEHEQYEARLGAIENWRSNVTGRAMAVALVGTIFVATVVAFITHLLST